MHRPESSSKRTAIRLSSPLEKKLIAYAAAASAAGVGLLACSLPAEGKVVSTSVWTEIVPSSKVSLDLNNDGIPDFQFSNPFVATSVSRYQYGTLKVLPQNQGNAIWGTGGSASALGSGVTIGPSKKLQPSNEFMGRAAYFHYSTFEHGSKGKWKEVTRRYLGFKFTINGEIHYAWARMNVAATNNGMYAAVIEYAYETVPNKPIVTSQGVGGGKNGYERHSIPGSLNSAPSLPGSLGRLAAGASGSSARRGPDAGPE
jgi:hypothetical protein